MICEHVRHRLGFQLVAGLQEADGALPLIQLNPAWEELFQTYQLPEGSGIVDVALPPAEFNRLANSVAEKIAQAGAQGRYPAVVTSTKRRRFLHTVLTAKGIRNPVLSFEEIGTDARGRRCWGWPDVRGARPAARPDAGRARRLPAGLRAGRRR